MREISVRRLALMASTIVLSSVLAACSKNTTGHFNGYVEAEPVRLASPAGGRLLALPIAKGDNIKAGQIAFILERDNEQAAVSEAHARVQQAEAQAADLQRGQRPVELAVHEANLRAAQAALQQTELELKRQRILASKGFASAATLDTLQAQHDSAAADVAQMQSRLAAARLSAREHSLQAAQSGTVIARAQLAQRQWLLTQKTTLAPADARIDDIYYRIGEWVPAGTPVLSLLPPAALKVRFYIPETALATLPVGSHVTITCDNCGTPIAAIVRFIAHDAEFTPPVLYNRDNRSKLVWLVEAVPSNSADLARLHPGQPVDVEK